MLESSTIIWLNLFITKLLTNTLSLRLKKNENITGNFPTVIL